MSARGSPARGLLEYLWLCLGVSCCPCVFDLNLSKVWGEEGRPW
jgi:hypothetical protein